MASGTFFPGTVSGSVAFASVSLPPGVTAVAHWARVYLVSDGVVVADSGLVAGQSASTSWHNPGCGVGATAVGFVQVRGSDGVLYWATVTVTISGVTVQPQAHGSIASPAAGLLNDFPLAITGTGSRLPTVTLRNATTGFLVALDDVALAGGQWSVRIVGALAHGHSYEVAATVPGTGCELSWTGTRAFSFPARFVRTRSWDVRSALGPLVTQAWEVRTGIRHWVAVSWSVETQINSPLVAGPTQAEVAAALRHVHRFRARLFIRWDGHAWTEETDRLLSAGGVSDVDLGTRFLNSDEASVVLDNGDDRFSARNRGSPIHASLARIGQAVRLVAGYDGHESVVFRGRVDSITPRVSDRTMTLRCLDQSAAWRQLRATYPPTALVRTDVVIRSMLLALGLVENVHFVLDQGDVTIPYAIAADTPLLPELQALAQAEGGRVFFDVAGVFHFWSRTRTRRIQATPVIELTTDDHLYELSRSTSPAGLATRVSMEWRTRDAQGDEVVFISRVSLQLAPGHVEDDPATGLPVAHAGAPVVVRAQAMDLTRWEAGIPAEFTSLDAIAANTARDGTGTSVTCVAGEPPQTSTLTGAVYHQTTFGIGVAHVVLRSMATIPVYVVTLRLRGRPQRSISPIAVTVADPEAVDSYGDIELTLTNPYTPDADVAMDRAREELAIRRDPLAVLSIPLQDGLPFLRTFDVVRVHDRSVAGMEEVLDGQVLRNEWVISPSQGYTQQLFLGPATPSQFRALASAARGMSAAASRLVAPPFQWGAARWDFAQWA